MIKTVYSLSELHDLVKNHHSPDKLFIAIDLDLTIVESHPEDENLDVLIEPETTKKLFDYMDQNEIHYTFMTARFYDTVCNKKKRNLQEIEENLYTTIFPLLEDLGMDLSYFKQDSIKHDCYLIKNDKNRTVGIVYRGIVFGNKKGEIIKHYTKDLGIHDTHHIIFIDDYDEYIDNVRRHVPHATILKREIGTRV